MLNVHTLCSEIKEKIVYASISKDWLSDIDGLLMPDPSQPPRSNYIYFCDAQLAGQALDDWSEINRLTLFVAGKIPPAHTKFPQRLNLVVLDVSVSELYNSLYRSFSRYSSWKNSLSDVPITAGSIKKLLQLGVTLSESKISLYALNHTFQVIDSCIAQTQLTRMTRLLNEGGFLSETQIIETFQNMELEDSAGNDRRLKTIYHIHPIRTSDQPLGYLLVIGSSDFTGYEELVQLLIRALASHISHTAPSCDSMRGELTKLFEDIFIFMPEKTEELDARLRLLPNRVKQYMRPVILSFGNEYPVTHVLRELDEIFPNSNIAPYASYIVILISAGNCLFVPEFDGARLDKLLEKYNGYAVIGDPCRFIRGLRTVFIQCKDTLRLLPKLHSSQDVHRYAFFEHLLQYYVIDLCAKTIQEHYGHDRLVYLAHPAIIEVMRYDKKHGTDLYEFLYCYISNDCTIASTAQALHMHRNTVMYKLKKLEEIMGMDLRDFSVRRKLLFSCEVIRYAEKVQNRVFSIDSSADERDVYRNR